MLHRIINIDIKTDNEFALAVRDTPRGATSLWLGKSSLHSRSGAALATALAAIPGSVTILDLGENHLHRKTTAELIQAFTALPSHVNTIGLSIEDISDRTQEDQDHIAESLRFVTTVFFRQEKDKRAENKALAAAFRKNIGSIGNLVSKIEDACSIHVHGLSAIITAYATNVSEKEALRVYNNYKLVNVSETGFFSSSEPAKTPEENPINQNGNKKT